MATFQGFHPGLPFHEMAALTRKNHRIGTRPPLGPFTVELMLAIFWEESPFFVNRRQFQDGRGVGFGQVERQELLKLTTDRAKEYGYFVPGVNASTVQLDDDRAVQIASCTLLHLWYHPDNVNHTEDRLAPRPASARHEVHPKGMTTWRSTPSTPNSAPLAILSPSWSRITTTTNA